MNRRSCCFFIRNLRTMDTLHEDMGHRNATNTDGSTISSREPSEMNYAYSSSTLPRTRKQRKPLYEVGVCAYTFFG